jgi:hypothetical protein
MMDLAVAAAAMSYVMLLTEDSHLYNKIAVPRLLRRFWSQRRLLPQQRREVSNGVWENICMQRAAVLEQMGCDDVVDGHYVSLFRMDKASFDELYDTYGWRIQHLLWQLLRTLSGAQQVTLAELPALLRITGAWCNLLDVAHAREAWLNVCCG